MVNLKLVKTGQKHINMSTKQTAVIDGDMIVYRSAFSSEKECQWDEDIWTLQTSMSDMKNIVDETMNSILRSTECDDYIVVFSDKTNFRYEIFPDYKANRKGKRKPLALKEITKWVFENHKGICWKNLEADDVVGMLCCSNSNYVAVSGDKDFYTLPCVFFNFLKGETSNTSLEEANYNHLVQSMSGDTVDGFSGASGIGPKTAQKLLDKNGATWETVVQAYESKDQTEEEALLNAQLSYILRDEKEYNKKKGTVNLWKPQKQK